MSQVKPYHERFNARDWAKAFVKEVKENPVIAFDEECMFNWFSSALLTGYEHGSKRVEEKYSGKQD